MYVINENLKAKIYDGGLQYTPIVKIGDIIVDNSNIKSLEISDPLIDTESKFMYLGAFVSKQLTLEFRNLQDIDFNAQINVSIKVKDPLDETIEEETVPLGIFNIESSPKDYYEKTQIVALDNAIKFLPNFEPMEDIVKDGITAEDLLKKLCDYYNVELGTYPDLNRDKETAFIDNTVSGKKYISYIAEVMGGFAKIDRFGKLQIVPMYTAPVVVINALASKSFKIGEKYKIGKVFFDNGKFENHFPNGIQDISFSLNNKEDEESEYFDLVGSINCTPNTKYKIYYGENKPIKLEEYENRTTVVKEVDSFPDNEFEFTTTETTKLFKIRFDATFVGTYDWSGDIIEQAKEKYAMTEELRNSIIVIQDITLEDNSLAIRQDNIFITGNETNRNSVVENIYNSVKNLEIYSIETENFIDITLDSYDIVGYSLGEDTYLTYYIYNYKYNGGTPVGKVNTQIPTLSVEETTNTLISEENTKEEIRSIRTTVNQQEATMETIANRTTTLENSGFVNIEQVREEIAPDRLSITAINSTIDDGVPKVNAEGFIFDNSGLHLSRKNESGDYIGDVRTNLDEKSFSIVENSTNNAVLYAGYDESEGETVIVTQNTTVKHYLKLDNVGRWQNYKYVDETYRENIDNTTRTGFFWTYYDEEEN